MNWIDDLSPEYGTVTGRFVRVKHDYADEDLFPDVQPLNGTVLLTPTVTAGRISATVFAHIAPVEARIVGGQIVDDEDNPGIRILSTDADTGVKNWGWKASFNIEGASIKPITFRLPVSGVHLTGDGLIPITGLPVEIIGADAMARLVTAEDLLAAHGQRLSVVESTVAAHAGRLSAVESTVDKIKLANQSAGTGAPSGTAPVGWVYTDIATGDVYRMEA